MPVITLHVDHLQEILQGIEGAGLSDIVDEEEGIGAEVRRCPKTAILFLASGVGEGEKVGLPVYSAGYGVGVLCIGCG